MTLLANGSATLPCTAHVRGITRVRVSRCGGDRTRLDRSREVHTWAEFEGFGALLELAVGCMVESSLTTGVRSGITGFAFVLGVADALDALRLAELL